MLIEEVITEKEELREFLPVLARLGMGLAKPALRGAKGLGRGLGRGAKKLGKFATKNPLRRIAFGYGAHQLASLFSKDPEAKKIHDEMEATDDEQERERLRLELERRIRHWENDMDLLYGQGWGESVNERELTKKEEHNKEHNVKKLKPHKDNFSKYGKDAESVMYAVATKQAKKGNRFKA